MAIVKPMDMALWDEWVASRPPEVQELCKRLPPDRLYRMSPNGERVTVFSYNEDGTVTVEIRAEYNMVVFERNVFGVKPDDLEECDLPSPNECGVALLTEDEEIDDFVAFVRPFVVKYPRANWVGRIE